LFLKIAVLINMEQLERLHISNFSVILSIWLIALLHCP